MNSTIHCIELILKRYKKNGHFDVKCEPSLKPETLIRFMLARDVKFMHASSQLFNDSILFFSSR